jgi:homocysteine S-methyltransferase
MGTTNRISRAGEFRSLLGQRAVVTDGAMGTMLYTRGIFINRCFDELNLSAPEMVKEIHQEYVRAGAEVLETNTFGATRARLATFGLAEKVEAINRAGVRAAREAASERSDVFVAGAIGPLGLPIEPIGPTSFGEARDMFREQAAALVDEGVDLLIFETFSHLPELREPAPKWSLWPTSPSMTKATSTTAQAPTPSRASWTIRRPTSLASIAPSARRPRWRRWSG